MAWYRTGTVNVTNGSVNVVGVGTQFVANVSIGEGFLGPDGRVYEIADVVSNTALTLAAAYQGATANAQAYAILPTQSALADLAAEAAELVNSFAAVRDGVGQGMFPDGTVAVPGIRFANDQDTGFYRIGANTFGISFGGVQGVSFNSGGWIGVGGANINAPFTARIANAGTATQAFLAYNAADSDRGFRIWIGTNGPMLDTNSGVAPLRLGVDGNEYVRILPGSGNVGIGTTNAGAKLEVQGAGGTAEVRIRSTDTAGASVRAYVNGAEAGVIRFFNGGGFGFETSGTERVRIEAGGTLRPSADNSYSLGSASFRWSVVYAGTGTINTSDEREKAWRGDLTDDEYTAGLRVIDELGFFQWNDAVAEKGADGARIHFGVRAQRVWGIFADAGLVEPLSRGKPGATPYAFLCYDEWGAVQEPVIERGTRPAEIPTGEIYKSGKRKGEPKTETVDEPYERYTGKLRTVLKAGDRFGIRPDQLCLFLLAVQGRRQTEIEKRLAALEK